jgi:phosphoglycolate phosphatase-like HAD superfamily hydrolase
MRHHRNWRAGLALVFLLAWVPVAAVQAADPLPSWNQGPSKEALVGFVAKVTKKGGPDYVPPSERIAVFDNDGTLWSEQPMYVQLAFALDRVRQLAPEHPEWKVTPPFKAVLEGDEAALQASDMHGLVELIMASHAGMTTEAFEGIVRDWLATARHPKYHRPYTELVYQPMLEVLAYLRANGFKTYIVSGGGVEFMRPWVEKVYGIPPEQVIGSRIKVKYSNESGKSALIRLPEMDFINDKAGKPVGIYQLIGRRPMVAFGNSDGDFEMLEWTTSAPHPRLGVIVHHDDAEREAAYDRQSPFGKLDRGLDEAPKRGWVLVSQQKDWKTVFPAPPKSR